MNLVSMLLLSPLLLSSSGGERDLASARVYVNGVTWEEPPPSLQKSYLQGDGEVMLLFPSGDFAYFSATLFRDKASGSITVCGGCGYSTKSGTWTRESSGVLKIRSRRTHRHDRPLPKDEATEEATEVACKSLVAEQETAPAALECEGMRFEPLQGLADPETVLLLLKSGSEDWAVPSPP